MLLDHDVDLENIILFPIELSTIVRELSGVLDINNAGPSQQQILLIHNILVRFLWSLLRMHSFDMIFCETRSSMNHRYIHTAHSQPRSTYIKLLWPNLSQVGTRGAIWVSDSNCKWWFLSDWLVEFWWIWDSGSCYLQYAVRRWELVEQYKFQIQVVISTCKW